MRSRSTTGGIILERRYVQRKLEAYIAHLKPLCKQYNIRMTCKRHISSFEVALVSSHAHWLHVRQPLHGGHPQARSSSQETGGLHGDFVLLQARCHIAPGRPLPSSRRRPDTRVSKRGRGPDSKYGQEWMPMDRHPLFCMDPVWTIMDCGGLNDPYSS